MLVDAGHPELVAIVLTLGSWGWTQLPPKCTRNGLQLRHGGTANEHHWVGRSSHFSQSHPLYRFSALGALLIGIRSAGTPLTHTHTHTHTQQPWPVYEAALAAGQKAQFRRARLIVDGVHVPVPMPMPAR
jgi:hypothetical protein